jgi:hypothetical protein
VRKETETKHSETKQRNETKYDETRSVATYSNNLSSQYQLIAQMVQAKNKVQEQAVYHNKR